VALRALVGIALLLCSFLGGVAGHRWWVLQRYVDAGDPREALYFWNYDPPQSPPNVARSARLLREYLVTRDVMTLRTAREGFASAVAGECPGSRVPALMWLSDYFLTPTDLQAQMLENPEGARMLTWLASKGFVPLRDLLTEVETRQIDLPRPNGMKPDVEIMASLLSDAGPTRAGWDAADDVVRCLGLRPGDSVADLHSGVGFWAYRLARAVGPGGAAYAVGEKASMVDFVRAMASAEGLSNLQSVMGKKGDVALLPQSLSCAFVCGYFCDLYGREPLAVRASWVESVKRALRPGGTLAVMDSNVQVSGALPCIGNRISRWVVIADLTSRGFRFKRCYELTPQRYVLLFERGAS